MEQAHGADRAPAGDGHLGHDRVVPPRVLDRRDDAQVDAPRVQGVGDPRGNVAQDLEARVGVEAVDEGDGVQVGDDPEAQLTTPSPR